MRARVLRAVAAGLVACAAIAAAEPMGLAGGTPEIFSCGISIEYDADTDIFSAWGWPTTYYCPGPYDICGGWFELTALIDDGGTASSGSLLITGATTGGNGSGDDETLLEADGIAGFGFAPDGSPGAPRFEFLMDITGGSLAPDFAAKAPQVGVILSGFNNWSDENLDWRGDFQSDYLDSWAVCDTVALPEPGSAWPMVTTVVMVVGACSYRRLCGRRRAAAQAG